MPVILSDFPFRGMRCLYEGREIGALFQSSVLVQVSAGMIDREVCEESDATLTTDLVL